MPHTPGPWIVNVNNGGHVDVSPDGGDMVCDLSNCDNADFNADLIAAAPELLEALDYLLAQTIDQDLAHGIELTEGEADARAKALSAIARATGN